MKRISSSMIKDDNDDQKYMGEYKRSENQNRYKELEGNIKNLTAKWGNVIWGLLKLLYWKFPLKDLEGSGRLKVKGERH